MELKHTPGPWFAEDDDWTDGDSALITCDAREGMVSIAKVEGGGSGSGYDYEFARQQAANAKLIAAAPELLDALQDALHAYDKHGEDPSWDFAREAIAKATGH
jgi:hypothetical protein